MFDELKADTSFVTTSFSSAELMHARAAFGPHISLQPQCGQLNPVVTRWHPCADEAQPVGQERAIEMSDAALRSTRSAS